MEPHCLGKPTDPGRSGSDNRRFVEAVLWIVRTGSPWRDLPPSFGNWNTVFKRYRDWVKADVFVRLFEACSDEPDMEYAMADATIVKVHRHGQGERLLRRRGAMMLIALGRAQVFVLSLLLSIAPATAQDSANLQADRFRGTYQRPKNPAHQHIYDRLRSQSALERIGEFLSPFRMNACGLHFQTAHGRPLTYCSIFSRTISRSKIVELLGL